MRRLKREELYHGRFVQCGEPDAKKLNATVYQILIEADKYYYSIPDGDWKMDASLVINSWYDTPLVQSLNRNNKIDLVV